MSRNVIIMQGIPGAGKSWYAKQWVKTEIVSADEFWCLKTGSYVYERDRANDAHNWCMRRFIRALEDDVFQVIVDNTNSRMISIAPYWSVAEAFGYTPVIHSLLADPEVHGPRNIHGVAQDVIRRAAARIAFFLDHTPKHWKVVRLQAGEEK